MPQSTDPRLLTPSGQVEDAAAYLYDEDRVLLFTTDFFTPVVDDPFTFGRIAAANAFSDVYAMGGRPIMAVNLMSFPTRTNRTDEMVEILKGGARGAREAGCLVVGGHTVDDREPKYGMAVIGETVPDKLLRKNGAKAGDSIILTKPLGTGILATAFKNDKLDVGKYEDAVASMCALNRKASMAAVAAGLSGATDVTGFGLLGHLLEMCRTGNLGAEVSFADLPFFNGVEDLAKAGIVPGGSYANRDLVAPHVDVETSLPDHAIIMAADAQTSGGLLLAVSRDRKAYLESALKEAHQFYRPVGTFLGGPPRIRLKA